MRVVAAFAIAMVRFLVLLGKSDTSCRDHEEKPGYENRRTKARMKKPDEPMAEIKIHKNRPPLEEGEGREKRGESLFHLFRI